MKGFLAGKTRGKAYRPVLYLAAFELRKPGALYPRDRLAEDADLIPSGGGFGGVTIAQNVGSPAEVDAALAQAVAAGGTLLKKAQMVF
jgi:hypothetical protein